MSIQVQIGLNRYKYVQIGPNESNWVQMGPNRYKQVQQRQRKSTKIKIKTNQAIGRYWKKQVQMGSNGSIGVQNNHELNRMAFKPRSPGSCLSSPFVSFHLFLMLCSSFHPAFTTDQKLRPATQAFFQWRSSVFGRCFFVDLCSGP